MCLIDETCLYSTRSSKSASAGLNVSSGLPLEIAWDLYLQRWTDYLVNLTLLISAESNLRPMSRRSSSLSPADLILMSSVCVM